ncbi:hypothetical protein WOB59_15430 [Methylocystis sp. IM4]|uniref:hypothetical protein n=1 Tax=Methylocystis sp. IM4 TaxID=3136560 RepID=UPI00311A7F57
MIGVWKMARAAALGGALVLPAAASAQGWSDGDRGYVGRGDNDGGRGGVRPG